MKHELYAVTNRHLCVGSFPDRIAALCRGGVSGVILREKDLSHKDYMSLSQQLLDICSRFCVPLIVNSDIDAARTLSVHRIQLPFPAFDCGANQTAFSHIGVSVHSTPEARRAEQLGASSLIAGHIFPTDCKPNLAPRGLDFLRRVCASVRIPVYAIGGITRENIIDTLHAGAAGVCIMSELMTCSDPEKTAREYYNMIERFR